jgi:hypothetical protein
MVLNAVVLWTTRYIDAAVTQLRTEGHEIRDEDVARLSPLKHRNLNVLGRYSFTASTPAGGGPAAPARPRRGRARRRRGRRGGLTASGADQGPISLWAAAMVSRFATVAVLSHGARGLLSVPLTALTNSGVGPAVARAAHDHCPGRLA